MSYFRKVARHDRDAEFITVKESDIAIIKVIKYRLFQEKMEENLEIHLTELNDYSIEYSLAV